ncbi:hypothetical protein DV736_g6093, partial [Chaetothyriales sp. CBS 134916]
MDVKPNPKDSIKSTWRKSNRSEWTLNHWFYEIIDIHPVALDREVPVHPKTDPVPYVEPWQNHRWILFHSLVPLAIHQAYVAWTGKNMDPVIAVVFYSLAFQVIGIRQLRAIRELGHKYGFYDGDKHERDGVPDVGVSKVILSIILTLTIRPLFTVLLTYRTNLPPSSINLVWLPLEIGLYQIILDFWFYWYHRLMHDIGPLWRFHRTHHLTKHPNPLLTLYADSVQEVFDIAGIPLAAYFTMKLFSLPMGFYEWWICHQYVVFTEAAGHGGIRIFATAPSTLSSILSLFGAEIMIEDHDLHHRKGWKSSYNYGKQTMLWDRLFGTFHGRVEAKDENIDYVNTVMIPLF